MLILRVDDRLVHGQVIAGWVRPLDIQCLIIASDRICQDEWACNAYQLAVPEGIKFRCLSINQCISTCNEYNSRRVMVIVETIREAYLLLEKGFDAKEVNIGGISYREGAREIAPYIYLSPDDINAVVGIYRMGIKVVGKQLPNSSAIDVIKTLVGVIDD